MLPVSGELANMPDAGAIQWAEDHGVGSNVGLSSERVAPLSMGEGMESRQGT